MTLTLKTPHKMGGGVEIYINILYIFLTCLLGPVIRSMSHCREGTRVLRVGKLGLLPTGVLAVAL